MRSTTAEELTLRSLSLWVLLAMGCFIISLFSYADQAFSKPRLGAKFSSKMNSSVNKHPEQHRYKAWIFFTDKDHSELSGKHILGKTFSKRRAKYRSPYLDRLNLPVIEDYIEDVKNLGAKIRTVSKWLNAISVEAEAETLRAIARLPYVMRVEQVKGGGRPGKPYVPRSAALQFKQESSGSAEDLDYGPSLAQAKQVNVPELHQRGLTGKGVTVCLLDVGFRHHHEVFDELNLIGQRDFVMGDDDVERDRGDPSDYDDGHGTMTWSVLGGYAPGKIIGPAFGANFLLGKTEDARSETPIEEDYWVAGLEWAENNGADIVSSSLGYLEFDDGSSHPYASLDGNTIITSRAANIASEMGVLVVNSMGNSGPAPKTINSPADSFGVLAVGAVNSFGMLASFSSRGPSADGRIKPDVVARGVSSYLATGRSTSSYGRANGTSFSAPLVAGVAALLLEANPEWTPTQLMDALRKTASKSAKPDNKFGYGIVNAVNAVAYIPTVTLAWTNP